MLKSLFDSIAATGLFRNVAKLVVAFVIVVAAAGIAEAATQTTTLTISGQNNVVISGLTISTTSGDCINIVNSTNVTIQASQIGPCGTNNTTANSHGISVSGSSSVNIYDNYIHVENLASGCCDSHDNVFVSGSSYVAVRGNVIAYGESNVELGGAANDHISVIGNLLLNPRGPFPRGQNVQSWPGSGQTNTNITVSNNYALSSQNTTAYKFPENQEDSINFGFTNGFDIENNYVTGGHSASGCGLIADTQANNGNFISNVLSNTGQCGIGITNGTNQLVDRNKILNLTPVSGGGNTGLYIWNQYSAACGPVTVSNDIVDALNTSGVSNAYWNGGGCGTPTLTNDSWNQAAYSVLYPMATTNPPPLVPPLPYSCVATSPYSTQTSVQPCSASASPPPPPPSPPPAPTASLSASPTSISSGQSSTLSWNSTNASSCSGAGFTASGISGSAAVTPAATSTYSVTCSGGGGSASASATVTVAIPSPPPPAAPTAVLSASPTSISSGQSSMLTWSSTNATSCSSSNFAASGISGSASITPAATSTYSVTCSGSGGSASASATVNVKHHGHH